MWSEKEARPGDFLSGKQRARNGNGASERNPFLTADGFCTLVLVNVAPRGAADQLCESAGLLGDTIGEMHRTDNSRGRALRSG